MNKLTEAQERVLREIISANKFRCVGTYPPAKKLVSLGYAAWFFTKHGQYLMATDAGRIAISGKSDSEKV